MQLLAQNRDYSYIQSEFSFENNKINELSIQQRNCIFQQSQSSMNPYNQNSLLSEKIFDRQKQIESDGSDESFQSQIRLQSGSQSHQQQEVSDNQSNLKQNLGINRKSTLLIHFYIRQNQQDMTQNKIKQSNRSNSFNSSKEFEIQKTFKNSSRLQYQVQQKSLNIRQKTRTMDENIITDQDESDDSRVSSISKMKISSRHSSSSIIQVSENQLSINNNQLKIQDIQKTLLKYSTFLKSEVKRSLMKDSIKQNFKIEEKLLNQSVLNDDSLSIISEKSAMISEKSAMRQTSFERQIDMRRKKPKQLRQQALRQKYNLSVQQEQALMNKFYDVFKRNEQQQSIVNRLSSIDKISSILNYVDKQIMYLQQVHPQILQSLRQIYIKDTQIAYRYININPRRFFYNIEDENKYNQMQNKIQFNDDQEFSLHVGQSSFTYMKIELFAKLVSHSWYNLVKINCTYLKLGNQALNHFTNNIHNFPNLRTIDFTFMGISVFSRNNVNEFKKLKKLQNLHLQGNPLSEQSLSNIFRLKIQIQTKKPIELSIRYGLLKKIDLSNMRVGSLNYDLLSSCLRSHHQNQGMLTQLDLSQNNFNSDDWLILVMQRIVTKGTTINLRDNKIQNISLASLKLIKQYKPGFAISINLQKNPLSQESLNNIKQFNKNKSRIAIITDMEFEQQIKNQDLIMKQNELYNSYLTRVFTSTINHIKNPKLNEDKKVQKMFRSIIQALDVAFNVGLMNNDQTYEIIEQVQTQIRCKLKFTQKPDLNNALICFITWMFNQLKQHYKKQHYWKQQTKQIRRWIRSYQIINSIILNSDKIRKIRNPKQYIFPCSQIIAQIQIILVYFVQSWLQNVHDLIAQIQYIFKCTFRWITYSTKQSVYKQQIFYESMRQHFISQTIKLKESIKNIPVQNRQSINNKIQQASKQILKKIHQHKMEYQLNHLKYMHLNNNEPLMINYDEVSKNYALYYIKGYFQDLFQCKEMQKFSVNILSIDCSQYLRQNIQYVFVRLIATTIKFVNHEQQFDTLSILAYEQQFKKQKIKKMNFQFKLKYRKRFYDLKRSQIIKKYQKLKFQQGQIVQRFGRKNYQQRLNTIKRLQKHPGQFQKLQIYNDEQFMEGFKSIGQQIQHPYHQQHSKRQQLPRHKYYRQHLYHLQHQQSQQRQIKLIKQKKKQNAKLQLSKVLSTISTVQSTISTAYYITKSLFG